MTKKKANAGPKGDNRDMVTESPKDSKWGVK